MGSQSTTRWCLMGNTFKRHGQTQSKLRVRTKPKGKTHTVPPSISDRLNVVETTGRTNRGNQSMTHTIARTERSKGNLVGCKPILAGLRTIACKELSKSPSDGGVSESLSIGIKSLVSVGRDKPPCVAAEMAENRGGSREILKDASLREFALLQGCAASTVSASEGVVAT